MLSVVSVKKNTCKLYIVMKQNCLRTKNCLQCHCTNARKMSVGIFLPTLRLLSSAWHDANYTISENFYVNPCD